MSDLNHFLNNSIQLQNSNIQSYHIGEMKVWLKKASARHSTWIYIPLRWLAQFFQLKVLTPIPNYGGHKAIQCEVQRIQSLQALGISTPTLLASSEYGLLIEDAAANGKQVLQLDQALAQLHEQPEQQIKLFHAAIDAISSIHSKNSYLSEAFARNILVDEAHQFTFIDFETDPGQVLDVQSCQVRDWLCLIFSTAHLFNEQQLAEASQIFLDKILPSTKTYLGILKVSHRLRWARHINFEKLGSDGKRAKKCFLFFKAIELQKPLPMI